MPELIKERCLYCGGDVYYHSRQKLIKCEWCGETINTVKFENVLVRMQETEEENAKIKQQLAKAEKENETSNDRLFSALSALGQIRDDQDVLGQMLHLLTGNQNDALGSLQFLKEISKRLIGSQNDIFARMTVVQDIASQIQKIDMDAQERQTVMSQFMLWSQQTQEEDLQRLQEIAASSDQLLQETQEIHAKVNDLREKSSHLQQTIDAFHTEYTRDKLQELQQLYHQAADFQHDMRFDTAEEYYHNVVTKGGADAEVYWRLIMCHYCLFYEKDDEGRMIPIILNPDLTDPAEMSLRKELDALMTEEERPYYTTKLQEIDRILDKYRLLKGEVQYDIFISVKQDDNGRYTADGDVASDLYDFLKKRGLSVFNSRRTAIPAGHEYEPYIISALLSSKVLIVVGTSPENMLSNWVKNEWSRFQWLQYRDKEKTGKTDRVLFCYLAKGMQAEQIPRALHPDRQAIYDGVKAYDELLAGISFLKTYKSGFNPQDPPLDFRLVADQMQFWLIKGEYDRVLSKYNELTEAGLFLSQAQLHLLALCAEKQVIDIQQVVCSDVILDEEKEFKAAITLCRSNEEKEKLKELLAKNQEWRGRTEIGKKTEKNPEPESAEDCLKYGIQLEAEKNYKEAVKWYREAAKKGLAEAQYLLGLCYENGNGIRKNKKQAENWYQKAASQNYEKAVEKLKITEISQPQNESTEKQDLAEEWYKLAQELTKKAEEANLYYAADEYKQAVELYKKAANTGHSDAQIELAICYFYGRGIQKNRSVSLKWYNKASNNCTKEHLDKYAEALYLEALYSSFTVNQVKSGYDPKSDSYRIQFGLDYFKLSAEIGNANAQKVLGDYYMYGGRDNRGRVNGSSIDISLALKWYKESSKGGNIDAKRTLAEYYCKETTPGKNMKEGMRLFKELAEENDAESQFRLSEFYHYGNRIPQDIKEAVKWCQKAAENDHQDAQFELGKCYWDPWPGIQQNYAEAIKWFKKAGRGGSRKGNVYAQYLLGMCYEKGIGVPASKETAIEWYQRAADKGDKEANKSLKRLDPKKKKGWWFF